MRRIVIAIVICLTLSVFCLQTAKAQEEPIPCDSLPSDMRINYGDLITCFIDSVGDTDTYRFNGKEGEVVRAMVSLNSGGMQPVISLIAPDNTRIHGGVWRNYNYVDTTLDQTGTFTIVIADHSNDQAGGYTLNLERFIPPTLGASRIFYGQTIDDQAIDVIGDSDLFFFEGREGDTIRAMVSLNSGGMQPIISLIAPDNTRFHGIVWRNYNYVDTTLDQTGTFTIVIADHSNDQAGGYTLNLECFAGICDIPAPLCNGRRATIVGTEGHDVIFGTEGPDVIHGLGTSDFIRGMGGDDVICGGEGADFLSGVGGNDILIGGNGHDAMWGGPGNDTLFGEDGHDTLYGGDGNDVLNGGVGDDGLVGLAGDDILNGNFGNDTLYGGDGVDELYGGTGPNSGTIDNNDTCYDESGTFINGCEVFYEQ